LALVLVNAYQIPDWDCDEEDDDFDDEIYDD
jgi:hypothetical protein